VLYDPATDSWTPAPPLLKARTQHAAALLPDGSLLIAGGRDGTGSLSAPERYTLQAAGGARPHLASPVGSATVQPGAALRVQGEGFREPGEAGGGNTRSSTADVPLLTLRSVESGQWFRLGVTHFSDRAATATLPMDLHAGHYVLTLSTRALSAGTVLRIQDTLAPETRFTSTLLPEVTRETHTSFAFSAQAVDLQAFECSRNGAAFSLCDSPQRWDAMSDGPYTFAVRARDKTGNVEASPVRHAWVVDTRPPDTVLGARPPAESRETSASIAFSSEEEHLDFFECSLDGASFARCESPFSAHGLDVGIHTLRVRARDRAGNLEPEPAEASWMVKRGYYGLNCAAGGASAWQGAPWALLLLGLLGLRRR
jgi:MYXO-CTERM domain-containing protein